MRLKDWNDAQILVERRKLLECAIENVKGGHGLGVTIGGTYQDEVFVDKVRPVVVQELLDRIFAIDIELIGLGVFNDAVEPAPAPKPDGGPL